MGEGLVLGSSACLVGSTGAVRAGIRARSPGLALWTGAPGGSIDGPRRLGHGRLGDRSPLGRRRLRRGWRVLLCAASDGRSEIDPGRPARLWSGAWARCGRGGMRGFLLLLLLLLSYGRFSSGPSVSTVPVRTRALPREQASCERPAPVALRTMSRLGEDRWLGSSPGRCEAGQDPGSLTFSNARTSASLSKWASR